MATIWNLIQKVCHQSKKEFHKLNLLCCYFSKYPCHRMRKQPFRTQYNLGPKTLGPRYNVNYKDLILSVKSAQRTHNVDCLFMFNVPPTAIKVICGRGYGFKSHPTDWRCRGSSLQGEFFIHYISHNVEATAICNDESRTRHHSIASLMLKGLSISLY